MNLSLSPEWRRTLAVAMLVLFLMPSVSSGADAPSAKDESQVTEEPQPKFIWGILIKFAASKAFEIFSEWTYQNMLRNNMLPSVLTPADVVSPPGAASIASAGGRWTPVVPNVTDSAPNAPLITESGKENFQGVHLALLVLQPDGQTFKVRPVSKGFNSGEKFRIRIGATFDGELSFDNINPKGKRERLYPANAEQVIKIRNSTPVILPLEKDSYFKFDDDVGEEKLIITLRDPRALGDAIAQNMVHRNEGEQGTGLLQEVAAGKYAAIAEAVAFQHR